MLYAVMSNVISTSEVRKTTKLLILKTGNTTWLYSGALICNKFLSVLSFMKVHGWVQNLLQATDTWRGSPQVCLRFPK